MDARKSPRFADNQRASSSSSSVRRLWTDQEEIALLQGLVEFGDDYAGFYDFIKGKGTITEDFSRKQMADKIRHAESRRFKKYELIEKNGCQLEFSTPHQKECYLLAKRIWGNAAAADDDETAAALGDFPVNNMNRKKRKASSGVSEEEEEDRMDDAVEKNGERVNGKWKSKKKKQEGSVLYYELIQGMDEMMKSPLSLESFLDQKAFQSIEPLKMVKLEKKRKKLQIHEMEVYLERMNFVRECSLLALDAMKSSTSCGLVD